MNAAWKAVIASRRAGLDFDVDLREYLDRGFGYWSPTAFVIWHREGDEIHIYLAAGDISEMLTIPHKPAKWVVFTRRGISRRYPYSTITRKFNGRRK